MSEDAKRPKDEKPDLPETFLAQFKCCECKKYLRPPVRTICNKGHYACGICFIARDFSPCPVSQECKIISENIQNVTVDNMIKDLKLPMSCKNHAAGCDFSGSLEDVIAHEEDCPYRRVKCVVPSCYQDIRFNNLETHMAEMHPKMSTGEWEIISLPGAVPSGLADILNLAARYTCTCCQFNIPHQKSGKDYCGYCGMSRTKTLTYAMRSWCHGGTRVFATLFVGPEAYWQIWVTAACGKTAADKFRAEIRLSSNIMPECNDVSYRPVLHFTSPILIERTSIDGYSACLHVGEKTVAKHIKGAAATAKLEANTEIPFKVNVYNKVFLTLDKADIEEKEESD